MPFSTNNIQPDFGTPLSYLYVGPPQANTGFTPIVASVDTLQIFWADAAHGGSDANDGLTDTTPKLTWTATEPLIRDGFPDHVLLRTGSVFNKSDESNINMVPFKSGRSSAEPLVFSTYGPIEDGRPELRNFDFNSTGSSNPVQTNTSYHGLNIDSTTRDPESPEFYITLLIKPAWVVEGRTASVTLSGTDSIEVAASYLIQSGDTNDTVAASLVAQLAPTVGVSISRSLVGSDEYIKVSRALPGLFFVVFASAHNGTSRPLEMSIELRAGEGNFSWLERSGTGENNQNIRFEDCIFKDYELSLQGYNELNRSQNWNIFRCIFPISWKMNTTDYRTSAKSAHLFTHETSGFTLKECTSDYGGWHPTYPTAGCNNRSHSFYLQYSMANDTVVEGNIISRGASHGVHQRAGGLSQDNFVSRCSIGLQLGYNQHPLEAGDIGYFLNNVISEGVSMAKGYGVDADSDSLTEAVWALSVADDEYIDQADMRIEGNITTNLGPLSIDPYRNDFPFASNRSGTEYDSASLVISPSPVRLDNIARKWDDPSQTQSENYEDPDRNLGTYYQYLLANGDITDLEALGVIPTVVIKSSDYDTMMGIILSRKLHKYDVRLTSYGINAHIREGLQIN